MQHIASQPQQIHDQPVQQGHVQFNTNNLENQINYHQNEASMYDQSKMSNTSAQIRTYKEALSATGFANGETNVVYGTRDDVHQFAADVDIVVFGVAKNVNAYQIATYRERHVIKVLNCELITTWAEARSNSFKVTIKAYQTERALSNEIWPYGVGVRRFRNQKGSARNKKFF